MTTNKTFPENDLNIPAALREIGATVLPSLPDRPVHVVLVGSVMYDNQANAKFTMREYMSCDGFLAETGGIFGVRWQELLLKNALISICYTDLPESFQSDRFQQATVAFWGKSIVGRGARVGSIAEYSATGCAARLAPDALDPNKHELISRRRSSLPRTTGFRCR